MSEIITCTFCGQDNLKSHCGQGKNEDTEKMFYFCGYCGHCIKVESHEKREGEES